MSEKNSVDVGKNSPPVGRAFSNGEGRGAKGFAKNDFSRPAEQPTRNRAYKGSQASGAKNWSDNKVKF